MPLSIPLDIRRPFVVVIVVVVAVAVVVDIVVVFVAVIVIQLILKISEIKLPRFEAFLTPLSSKNDSCSFEFKYKER